jgi:hypothetical protein
MFHDDEDGYYDYDDDDDDRKEANIVAEIPDVSLLSRVNPLTPNDHYSGRTASLTSKRCILYIYSTNIGTEYFKHGIYSPLISLQNAVCFIILTYLVPYYSHFIYRVC